MELARLTHRFPYCGLAHAFPLVCCFLAGLRTFRLVFTLASSARMAAVIFAESTLYRAAARARFESFVSACAGLYPGQYRSETRAHTTRKRCRSAAIIAATAAVAIFS